jgi:plasmid stability protein
VVAPGDPPQVREAFQGVLTCATHAVHVEHMAKMIQIRHVPDSLHRRLRARAAMAGMSLSDFLRLELTRSAEQLTPDELRTRLAAMSRTVVKERPAEALRAERDRR